MILDDQRTPIRTTITGETSEFRIATNSKAFRVLVDGIYADKVGSIVRELMSNAYDAHVRQDNLSTPFEVRLPNSLNPVFSIRDFGCSMTHEFVMQSYSCLFESSKGATNEEVGAFGLGAKSFLAYTDACTLTCWADDERRSYAVAINDSGVPEVRLVHRAPSDEPCGVEVQFATRPEDFTAFAKAAALCAYGYDVLPRFLGQEIDPETPLFSGQGWRWYARRLIPDSDIIVRQGCAVYPTNRWRFGASRFSLSSEGTLIVDRPIGTVTVTASRESLAMSHDQTTGLDDAIKAAVEALNERVRERYYALPTPIERARFAHENSVLLGRGDWPTSVRTPWPLMKFDQGALVAYDLFHIVSMAKLLLIHDDGTPIPRRLLRLRALARSGKSIYVESDWSKIEQTVELLGLETRQVIKMNDIPDVRINRTTRSAGRQKKEVITGSVWANCNRNKVQAGPLHWSRDRGTLSNCLGGQLGTTQTNWIESVIHLESSGKPLLLLTDAEVQRALRTGKIVEENRLDLVLIRHLLDQDVRQRIGGLILYQTMGRAVRSDSVRSVMLERLGLPITAPSAPLAPLFRALLPDVESELETEAAQVTSGLAERYPLLFRFDTQAALDYIHMCETKELAVI